MFCNIFVCVFFPRKAQFDVANKSYFYHFLTPSGTWKCSPPPIAHHFKRTPIGTNKINIYILPSVMNFLPCRFQIFKTSQSVQFCLLPEWKSKQTLKKGLAIHVCTREFSIFHISYLNRQAIRSVEEYSMELSKWQYSAVCSLCQKCFKSITGGSEYEPDPGPNIPLHFYYSNRTTLIFTHLTRFVLKTACSCPFTVMDRGFHQLIINPTLMSH